MSLTQKRHTYVDDAIAKVTVKLQELEVDSDEYGPTLEHLSKLQKIRQDEKPDLISPDTILTVGANLFGILLIIKHERADIITSKAMLFISKLK